MTPTESKLAASFNGPVVRLSDISESYLNMTPQEAMRLSALNQLPFPTFRIRESRKAPIMVTVEALAAHIDAVAESAKAQWAHSQV